MKTLGLLAGTLVVVAGSALASDYSLAGPIGRRQIGQQHRIHQGVRSGELTRREAGLLEREQKRIRSEKRQAWSDGRLGPGERARIDQQQDRASRHIYRLKHNRVDRNR